MKPRTTTQRPRRKTIRVWYYLTESERRAERAARTFEKKRERGLYDYRNQLIEERRDEWTAEASRRPPERTREQHPLWDYYLAGLFEGADAGSVEAICGGRVNLPYSTILEIEQREDCTTDDDGFRGWGHGIRIPVRQWPPEPLSLGHWR